MFPPKAQALTDSPDDFLQYINIYLEYTTGFYRVYKFKSPKNILNTKMFYNFVFLKIH